MKPAVGETNSQLIFIFENEVRTSNSESNRTTNEHNLDKKFKCFKFSDRSENLEHREEKVFQIFRYSKWYIFPKV
jgi:hypothetical protein